MLYFLLIVCTVLVSFSASQEGTGDSYETQGSEGTQQGIGLGSIKESGEGNGDEYGKGYERNYEGIGKVLSGKQCFDFQSCKGEVVTEDIDCRGYQSCQEVSGGKLTAICTGDQSCMESDLTLSGILYGDGNEAIKDSKIKARRVFCSGQRGCLGATIMPYNVELNVICVGSNGCLNTKIKCTDGQICTVACLGNGCQRLGKIGPTYFDCTKDAQCDFECLAQYCPNRKVDDFGLEKKVIHTKNNNNYNINSNYNVLYVIFGVLISCLIIYYGLKKYVFQSKDISNQNEYQTLITN